MRCERKKAADLPCVGNEKRQRGGFWGVFEHFLNVFFRNPLDLLERWAVQSIREKREYNAHGFWLKSWPKRMFDSAAGTFYCVQSGLLLALWLAIRAKLVPRCPAWDTAGCDSRRLHHL